MDWSWLNFVVFWVAVMSGALSIFREAVQIFPPGRITKKLQKSLFWRCVWIAFVVSAVWSWIVERNARIAAEHEIDRFEISMRPYVAVEKVKLLKGLHVGEQIPQWAEIESFLVIGRIAGEFSSWSRRSTWACLKFHSFRSS